MNFYFFIWELVRLKEILKNCADFFFFPSQTVEADGMLCEAEPASSLPLTQQYYVY